MIIKRIWRSIAQLLYDRSGDMPIPPPKKEDIQKIGHTIYIVTSCFKETAKGNIVDKIIRLIERDAASGE